MSLSRRAGLITAAIGAVSSLGLLISAGRGAPPFLLVLFIGWVLSPFVALAWAARVGLTIVVTLASLAIYTNAVVWHPTKATPTATFLLVPLGSWLLLVCVVLIAAAVSRRRP